MLSKTDTEKLAKKWVGRRVTAGCSGQLMTAGQARSLYGTAVTVDRVTGKIVVKCDDGLTRRFPANHLSFVLSYSN